MSNTSVEHIVSNAREQERTISDLVRIVNRLIEEHPEIDFSEQEEDSVYNHRVFYSRRCKNGIEAWGCSPAEKRGAYNDRRESVFGW